MIFCSFSGFACSFHTQLFVVVVVWYCVRCRTVATTAVGVTVAAVAVFAVIAIVILS